MILLYGPPSPRRHFHDIAPAPGMIPGQVWLCETCDSAYEYVDLWDGYRWKKLTKARQRKLTFEWATKDHGDDGPTVWVK